VHCLIIKQPYVDQILAGEKTVEYRSTHTNIRGRIGLIASGAKGLVLGTVELFDFFHEWRLRSPKRFEKPVPVPQKPGCVRWVTAHGVKGLE
jgi:hypothetical protein